VPRQRHCLLDFRDRRTFKRTFFSERAKYARWRARAYVVKKISENQPHHRPFVQYMLQGTRAQPPSSLSIVTCPALARQVLRPVRALESVIQDPSTGRLLDGRGAMMSSLCELLAAADCARSMADRMRTESGLRAARCARASYARLNRAMCSLEETWVRVRRDAERVSSESRARCVARGTLGIPAAARRSIVELMGPYTMPRAFRRRVRSAVVSVQRSVFRVTSGWGWGGGGSAAPFAPGPIRIE